MKREEDKRLIIPNDAFEEEASEGLGRLNKEEAAEDMHDLESRLARRLRKPIRVWIPAAAAVIIILIASTLYISLFRDRKPEVPDIAMVEGSKKDTVLIAMAEPVTKAEVKAEVEAERFAAPVIAEDFAAADKAEIEAEEKGEVMVEMVIDIIDREEMAEEIIVQALPVRAEAMKTAGSGKAETRKKANVAEERAEAIPGEVIPDHPPLPVGGVEELNSWFNSNLRYPDDISPRTRQKVIVSFSVRPDRTIYDLKAELSPGTSFTEEAFRLLREGPRWDPAIRNGLVAEETVKVRITFK
ncbi:MAG: energy transducer TonB [Bacteroidales bacterium]|nr:energy transducer TonB [Bacteroidales bacterium]